MTSTEGIIEDVANPQVDHSPQKDLSDKDYNFRALREVVKEKNDLIARQNQELEELRLARQAAKQVHQEPDDEYGLNDLDEEDALEIKKAKEIFRKVPKTVEREVEKILAKQNKAQQDIQNRMNESIQSAKGRYDDFDEVMAQDNVETIINKVPAVHHIVSNSPDPIEAAYHLIKSSSAYDKKTKSKATNMVEKAKLEENQKKPKSPNAMPSNQSSASSINTEAGTFSRLSKQQQKELWTEHNRKLGRRG